MPVAQEVGLMGDRMVVARRMKRIIIAEHHLLQLLSRPSEPHALIDWIESPLPADLSVRFVRESQTSPGIVAFCESETFPEVQPGQEIPALDVTYRRYRFENAAPDQFEMMRELGDALGHDRTARVESPQQVWREYLKEVREMSLRAIPFS